MEFCELYPDIKKYALEHKTPIIMEDSLEYIKELIKENKHQKGMAWLCLFHADIGL